MKKLKKLVAFSTSVLLSAASLMIIIPSTAHAAVDTCTWTGGGTAVSGKWNMSDGNNWTGCDNGTVPEVGDDLVFPVGVTNRTINNDFIAGTSFNSITFNGSVSDYTLYSVSGNAFSVAGGITGSVTGTVEFDISANLTLTGPQSISMAADNLVAVLGTLDIGSNAISVSGAGNTYVPGVLGGSGAITKSGLGYLSLNGSNIAYSGSIVVNAGMLVAGNNNALGTNSGDTTVNDGANIEFQSCTSGLSIGENITLSGSSSDTTSIVPVPKMKFNIPKCIGGGGVVGVTYGVASNDDGSSSFTGTLTLQNDITVGAIGDANITGAIVGNHKINLVPGYVGKVNINSSANGSSTPNGVYKPDKMKVTLSDDLPTTNINIINAEVTVDGKRGDVSLSFGGILRGHGTVKSIMSDTTSTIAPGNSPGCLNSGDAMVPNLDVELGGTTVCDGYDQLNVTGTVSLNGSLTTSFYGGFTPKAGDTFVIVKNDGSDAITGTFAGLPEGATVTVDGVNFKITYAGGEGGNDVVLTVASVPATPNTGFGTIVTANPLLTFIATTILAGGILVVSKKYQTLTK